MWGLLGVAKGIAVVLMSAKVVEAELGAVCAAEWAAGSD